MNKEIICMDVHWEIHAGITLCMASHLHMVFPTFHSWWMHVLCFHLPVKLVTWRLCRKNGDPCICPTNYGINSNQKGSVMRIWHCLQNLPLKWIYLVERTMLIKHTEIMPFVIFCCWRDCVLVEMGNKLTSWLLHIFNFTWPLSLYLVNSLGCTDRKSAWLEPLNCLRRMWTLVPFSFREAFPIIHFPEGKYMQDHLPIN